MSRTYVCACAHCPSLQAGVPPEGFRLQIFALRGGALKATQVALQQVEILQHALAHVLLHGRFEHRQVQRHDHGKLLARYDGMTTGNTAPSDNVWVSGSAMPESEIITSSMKEMSATTRVSPQKQQCTQLYFCMHYPSMFC